MDDQLDKLDYYTLLGLEPAASEDDIKRAFRQFARRYHPDRFAGAPVEKIARASQIYRRGSEAYQVLTDAGQRRAYDEALRAGILRLTGDARERVAAREKRQSGTQEAAKHPIQSPQARAYFQKAVEASHAGDWRGAWKLIKAAMDLEPGSEFLKSRLAMVERRLR